MSLRKRIIRACWFAVFVSGVCLLCAAIGHSVTSLNRIERTVCAPGSVLARAIFEYNPFVAYQIGLKDVALAVSFYALIAFGMGIAWQTRRRWLNLAHCVFIIFALILAVASFVPHNMVRLWGAPPVGGMLMGNGTLAAIWRTPIQKDDPKPHWKRVRGAERKYVLDTWYANLPGVEYYFQADPMGGIFGFGKAKNYDHNLHIQPVWALVPLALYPLMALWFYVPSSRGKPCPNCGYNLQRVEASTCPGCDRPI